MLDSRVLKLIIIKLQMIIYITAKIIFHASSNRIYIIYTTHFLRPTYSYCLILALFLQWGFKIVSVQNV